MSGLTLDFLNNVTRTMFIKVLKDQMYDMSPLFKRMFLNGRVKPLTGTALEWSVVIKRHQAVGRYSGYDVFASQPINPVVNALLYPANYYTALAISGEEERKNSGNAEKQIDMVRVQMENAKATMQEVMYTDLYSDGSLVGERYGIYGLKAVISASNTYANINRATAANAPWRAQIDTSARSIANMKDPTNTAYLPSIMRSMYALCTHGSISPDTIITTKTLHTLYQDIYGVNSLRGSNAVANLGFGAVEFSPAGAVMFDDNCPAYYMWFLTSSTFAVHVYAGANFDTLEGGWVRPHNQDAKVTQIIWSGQMKCDTPRVNGAYTQLGTS
jgi:hypothetical protein